MEARETLPLDKSPEPVARGRWTHRSHCAEPEDAAFKFC
jgi:hypothetical protein